jgi:hypothetical protein
MLGMLGGNKDSVDAYQLGAGKKIVDLRITETDLIFTFEDGYMMALTDQGQSCCEYRYMHTDDNLEDYIGSILMDAEVQPGAEEDFEWGECKDSEFLIITTSKGQFTVVNYNEHNGYYGGFAIRARAWKENA